MLSVLEHACVGRQQLAKSELIQLSDRCHCMLFILDSAFCQELEINGICYELRKASVAMDFNSLNLSLNVQVTESLGIRS